MKRLTALTLALSLCFTLVGCGGNPSSNAPASVDKSTASSGTASTEETYVLKLGMQQGNVDRSESAEVTWVERFKERSRPTVTVGLPWRSSPPLSWAPRRITWPVWPTTLWK